MSGGWIATLTPMLLGIGLLAGLMIGCIGVGGVILTPTMTLGCGIPISTAASAAMMGYIATGLSGSLLFGRSGALDRGLALRLCIGAAPGALIGAWAIQIVNPMAIQVLIAALATGAGLNRLNGECRMDAVPFPFGSASAIALGGAIGLISAMTGTGGPVVLVPLLIWLGFPILAAVGLGQAIQIPIALLATAGAYLLGSLDTQIGAQLTAGLVVGSIAGARIAHRLPDRALHATAAVILIATGGIVTFRLIAHFLA
ncbi:sulfite exporter TauE/SafE family protein [Microvirga massiliensis]|uniref:sulfite exporter TauE/SafE family protein n=1 Tax=Microvirga massiliensis TaxID=1033741 RepID=UPI00062B536B|nr:sulfite exporter TauE/SafE family protein [Microvirga massiliensis]